MKMRGVKPDFWIDENLVEVSIPARLLFIGLWMLACDHGHVEDSPKRIKMALFPADGVIAEELLQELAGIRVITREGGWITVPKLAIHQKIDPRYFLTCKRPGCVKPAGATPGRGRTSTPDPSGPHRGHTVRTSGPRDEGEGEGEGEGEELLSTPAPSGARGARIPESFAITEPMRLWAKENAPWADVDRDTDSFRDYWTAITGAKGVKKDWTATWRNWMRNASDRVPDWKRQQPATTPNPNGWMQSERKIPASWLEEEAVL